jgi:transcriptional regulator with XRE-family HTH domain
MKLKDQIRQARLRKGLNQRELAKAVGVELQTVKYWEGEGKDPAPIPRPKPYAKLENLLGVRLSTTGNIDGEMPNYTDGLSPEAIDLAKTIGNMPKEMRETVVNLIGYLTGQQQSSA